MGHGTDTVTMDITKKKRLERKGDNSFTIAIT